ncbi:ABC transporter permease [Thermomonospora cellulosilytica]|uniref:Peptide/nickel transport system permease protein n=1 Tax=Thermomonospora cellulosilytica TaxID=1411118 RepID=A0A7W3R6I3_9ACTN|nr:ABC transporter permease [Thermomonospora cellulosilytica]MBA9001561.1 peptide/nickel transport system permease protein [Thermomonospora cellulosilytica]
MTADAWRPAGRRPGGAGGSGAVVPAKVRLGAAVGVLVSVVAAAVVLPMLAGDAASGRVDYDAVLVPPGTEHLFGTDDAGRDVLVRAALGTRVSLVVAVTCALVATVLGTLVGAVAGAAGGLVDAVVMRLVDGINAVPHLLLGILIVALYRGSLVAVIASIALTHWTTVARIVRAQVLSLRTRPYIDAAISGGASRWTVLSRHLLPAVAPQSALAAALLLPHAVWHETALSFLGLGLPPHLPSLGTMVADSRDDVLLGAWWTIAAPAGALVAVTLAVAGLAGWWRDRLVPRRRSELAL